jgi:hypothetical protein
VFLYWHFKLKHYFIQKCISWHVRFIIYQYISEKAMAGLWVSQTNYFSVNKLVKTLRIRSQLKTPESLVRLNAASTILVSLMTVRALCVAPWELGQDMGLLLTATIVQGNLRNITGINTSVDWIIILLLLPQWLSPKGQALFALFAVTRQNCHESPV